MLITKNGVPFYLVHKMEKDQFGEDGEICAFTLANENIGFLTYENDEKSGWIKDIGVDEKYYDQGVGHALISAYEESCKQSGKIVVAGLFYPMNRGDEIVFNFYKRHGYVLSIGSYLPIIQKRIDKKDKPFSVKEQDFQKIF